MSKRVSWKAMAIRLGDRMANHAWCEAHPLPEAIPADCPFCHDRAVYLDFVQRLAQDGERLPDDAPKGRMVPLDKITQWASADGEVR